jgi:hypothetical protein
MEIFTQFEIQISPKSPKTCIFLYFYFFGPNIERKLKSETFCEKNRKTDFFDKVEYLGQEGMFFLH